MTEEELQKQLEETLPAAHVHGLFVEECQDQDVRLRFSPSPDGTWSTAALLTLLDTALRAAAGLEMRPSHLAVTVLGEAWATDIIALSRVIRRDGEIAHAEAWLFSHAVTDPLLHATASLVRRGGS